MAEKPEMLPEARELLDSQRRTWAGLTTVAEKRRAWSQYAASLARPAPTSLAVSDSGVPSPDGPVPIRLYRPRDKAGPLPCVIYMHGGGFMMGDLDSSDSIAWGFAEETDAAVISVDYRLTPEHPFPAAFNDCWAVLTHVHAHPQAYGIEPTRIALAGDSAGAKLTAGLSLKARDEGSPSIAGQAMIYGTGGTVPDTDSMRLFAEGYGLTAANSAKYQAMLTPTDRFDRDAYAWPIRAADHAGLPAALVHTAELDPGRDSARHYAAKLVLAGVPTEYREAKGLVHGFMRLRFIGHASRAEFSAICGFLERRLFG